jgi:hypothetical protein
MPTGEDLQPSSYLEGGWLNPANYNYTLAIPGRVEWTGHNYEAKYRSLLKEVRNARHIHRRSRFQDLGTKLTCLRKGA